MGRELSSRETERVEEVCRDRNLGQIVFSSTPNMNADRGREGLATSQDDSRREKQKGAQEGKGKGSLCSPTRKRTKRTEGETITRINSDSTTGVMYCRVTQGSNVGRTRSGDGSIQVRQERQQK